MKAKSKSKPASVLDGVRTWTRYASLTSEGPTAILYRERISQWQDELVVIPKSEYRRLVRAVRKMGI